MPPWPNSIAFALLALALPVAAVADWRTGHVPNRLTYPAILLGLALWAIAGAVGAGAGGAADGAARSAAAALAALIPFALLFFAGGLGGGDVKLMTAVGAITAAWECVLGTAVYAFVIAAAMAIVVMVRRRIVVRTLRRLLGAALTAAARVKPDLPSDSPRVPFAAAICAGGLLAGAEHLLGLRLPWSGW